MKFLFSRDLRDQAHIRLSLIFYFIALALFWALNWPYEASTFGLYPGDIVFKLLGDPELFASPMKTETLLLNIHIRLFLYTVSLLTVSAVYFRLPKKPNHQLLLISATYTLVLINMMGAILVRFTSEHFVWVKFLGFWGFQFIFGWMVFQSLLFLVSPKKKATKHV